MRQPIDPDLAALQTTIYSLFEGGDEQLPAGGAGQAVAAVDEAALHLKARSDQLLGGDPGPSRLAVEALLTESCTLGYTLEARRLRTKRRILSALADTSQGRAAEDARGELRELLTGYSSITRELERVTVVIARLRARLEKAQPT